MADPDVGLWYSHHARDLITLGTYAGDDVLVQYVELGRYDGRGAVVVLDWDCKQPLLLELPSNGQPQSREDVEKGVCALKAADDGGSLTLDLDDAIPDGRLTVAQ